MFIAHELVLDRIEGDLAVLISNDEKDKVFKCSVDLLPSGIKEGDVIKATFRIDDVSTQNIKLDIANMLDDLLGKKDI